MGSYSVCRFWWHPSVHISWAATRGMAAAASTTPVRTCRRQRAERWPCCLAAAVWGSTSTPTWISVPTFTATSWPAGKRWCLSAVFILHTRAWMRTRTHTIDTHACTHTYTWTHAHTCKHTYTHMHMCTRRYIHTREREYASEWVSAWSVWCVCERKTLRLKASS